MDLTGIDVKSIEPRKRKPFYKVRLAPKDAWTCTLFALLFNILGMGLEYRVNDVPNLPSWQMIACAAVGLVLLFIHLAFRKRPNNFVSGLFFLINESATAASLWISAPYFAMGTKPWPPFQVNKLLCLIGAMIAPGFWVGLVGNLAHSLSSVVQYVTFPAAIKERVAAGEPGPTLAFGMAGVFALIYRFRKAELEQELTWLLAKAEAEHRLAQAFLVIRDRMNTPLQVIEFGIEALREKYAPAPETLDQIERATENLRSLNQMLKQYESENRSADTENR